jgi:malate/lactate dehydrogenase
MEKVIGNIGEDTYVGVTFANAWTINIQERYHKFSELDVDEVEKFIKMLRKAKKEVIKKQKQEARHSSQA